MNYSKKGSGLKILVIEDDQQNAQLIGTVLKKEKFSILMTTNGGDGLRLAKANSPDLIILDVNLPDSSGFDICEKIKNTDETQSIPIIFLTAEKNEKMKLRSFEVGRADYVNKPFDQLELLARIKAHLKIKILREQWIKDMEVKARLKSFGVITGKINNPITSILNNLELIEKNIDHKNGDPKKVKEYIKEAKKSGEEIINKVNELKEFKDLPCEEYEAIQALGINYKKN